MWWLTDWMTDELFGVENELSSGKGHCEQRREGRCLSESDLLNGASVLTVQPHLASNI